MYCPKCRTEYREGFIECSDCKAALVSYLPPKPDNLQDASMDISEENIEFGELVTIFRSNNQALAGIAKSLLDEADIPYFDRNRLHNYRDSELKVHPGHVEEAMDLLAELLDSEDYNLSL